MNNYTGTAGVDQDCPRQTGMCGHSTYKDKVLKAEVTPAAWGLPKVQVWKHLPKRPKWSKMQVLFKFYLFIFYKEVIHKHTAFTEVY